MDELEEKQSAPQVESAGADVRTDHELDSLADDSGKATNRDRPMKAELEKQAAKPPADQFEFVHNGKPVKGTREQILKWAQMGYDYPMRAQKLTQEKQQWDAKRQDWEKQWGLYKQIDDYAKTNKDWWQFVQQSWQNKGVAQPATPQNGAPAATDPYAPKFQALEQKLSQFEQIAQTLQEEKRASVEKEEDQRLEQEIRSIREQHKDLDWDTLDENGKSLELKVLEHAQSTGIPTFKAAMRDLLHDELVTRAQTAGKLAVSQGIQKRTRLGVIGETPTPTKGMPPRNRDMRKTSYEEIENEIREELRSGRT